jgi:hypothetical protein
MARRVCVQFAGTIYDIMNRGDHREPILEDDDDRGQFLSALTDYCDKTAWFFSQPP